MNNYIKIINYDNDKITGLVHGEIHKDDLVELYDNINNPLGIYSHIKAIKMFDIDYDNIDHGNTAQFIVPGLSDDILDLGMKLVASD